ncbi:MAG: TetR family transcriptional regulator C-terminal domain-containing protein [Steroidobacteraceae bacterium]
MSARRRKLDAPVRAPRATNIRGRQRQRLIDACISALHIYGPSRTTVEKVVAIAKMSPGIVRFYFDSKAAMLVASLQFLAAEFEEQVLVPVAKLKARPVAALELMVDLYLDPDIASPRKVSVWYAFWGEASSRQEYYDICGQKDESFAALVRELIGRLVEETSQAHLDPDAIALGLIGALEMMWQDFAFQAEGNIDRLAAKRRCMAYLRSIFPGQFPHPPTRGGDPAAHPARFAGWVYASARTYALEREAVFQSAWQVAGHESQIARAGEYFTVDTGAERALLVRDSFGQIHALRNSCPALPHTLVVGGSGRFDGSIACTVHGLQFALDGRRTAGAAGIGLSALDLQVIRGLLVVRSPKSPRASPANPGGAFEPIPPGLVATGPAAQTAVAADWKLLVEQWLDSAALGTAPNAAAESLHWTMPPAGARHWSAQRYRTLAGAGASGAWQMRFIAPNQLLQLRPDGVSILQAMPAAPGRSRVRRLDYTVCGAGRAARAMRYLAARTSSFERPSALALVESLQRGVIDYGYQAAAMRPIAPAIAWFRQQLLTRIPMLALDRPPTDC